MVALGFTGAKAIELRERVVCSFHEMEQHLASLLEARHQFPQLASAIGRAHKHPRPYHFSNECDMLNRLVLGQTAAQFKKAHPEIPKGAGSIRPYLTAEQIALVDELQQADIAYLAVWPDDYQMRVDALVKFMRSRGHEPLWTGSKNGTGR